MELILASSSPFRIQQLKELGVVFKSEPSNFNEDTLKNKQIAPETLALELATAKANEVKARFPNSLIIGADQLLDLNGTILGKANSKEKAKEQLTFLSGKTHRIITAMRLITPLESKTHIDISLMKMRSLSQKVISDYVELHQTWNCAGSYKIECQPALIFSKIETQDPTAIIGLPTLTLISWLKEIDFLE